MARYICSYCGHVHDEAEGDPDGGVTPGTCWEDMPDDWVCPDCGQPRSAFARDI